MFKVRQTQVPGPPCLGMAIRAAAVVLAATLTLLAQAAAAHSTVHSSDGRYRIVVGQLEEPVVTHAKTGLDLCFTLNNTARTPVSVDTAAFEDPLGRVTLVSPDGEELSMPLRAQFGRPGCYQFEEPYVLTQPGQYTVSLRGQLNGTPLDFSGIEAGGAVIDQDEIRFPAANAAGAEDAPLPATPLLLVGLAGLAALRRRA